MRKLLSIIIPLLSAFLYIGCQEKEPAFLFCDQESILADQDPYKTTIEVKTNVAWTVSSNAEWCSVYGTNGSFRGSFEVVLDRNTSIEDRSTTIVLAGGGQTYVIAVTQTGASFCLTLPVTEYTVNNTAQSVDVAYVLSREGVSAEAFSSADWAKVESAGNGVAKVSVEANRTGKVRTAEISIVAKGGSSDPAVSKATITQSYTEDILDIFVEEVALGSEGETRRIPVQSNSEMDVLSSESWCIAVADGSFIKISAEVNTTGKVREAFVSLSLKDANDGARTKLIKVTQAASTVIVDLPVTSVTINRAGDVMRLPYTTDASLTVTSGADWCRVEASDGYISISADENNTGAKRTGYVTVKAVKDGNECTKLITVTQVTEAIVLDVLVEELLLGADGTSRNIPYTSDCAVTAKSSESWLKAEVADDFITVSAEPNATSSAREAYVTVTASGKGHEISRSVRVLQSKTDVVLELTVSEVVLGKSGEAQRIPFMSTADIVVESGASWCTVSAEEHFISVSANENKTGNDRTAYIVVRTASVTGSEISRSVKVTQTSSETVLSIPVTEATLNRLGSEVKLPFSASCAVDVESGAEWLIASVKDKFLLVSAMENTTGEPRTAYITITTVSGTDSDQSKVITVTQGTEAVTLDIPADEVKMARAGGEVRIPFVSSTPSVSVESGAEWLSGTVSGQFISVIASESSELSERTAYIVVKADAGDGNVAVKNIKVTQVCEEMFLEVGVTEVSLDKSGTSVRLPFSSSSEIVVESGAKWCNATVSGAFIEISAEENKAGKERSCYVTVSTVSGSDREMTRTIAVTQGVTGYVLDVLKDRAVLGSKASEAKIPLVKSSNAVLDISTGASWLSASEDGGFVRINVEDNTTGSVRTAYLTVSLAGVDDSQKIVKTVEVVQTATEVALYVSETEMTLSSEAESRNLPYECAYAVSSESSEKWLKASASDGLVTLTAEANRTGSSRTAYVTLTTKSGQGTEASAVIKVTQGISKYVLDVLEDRAVFSSAASETKLPLVKSSNATLSITAGADWVSAAESGDYLAIKVNANTTGAERRSFVTVSLAGVDDSQKIVKTVEVVQTMSGSYLYVADTELMFPPEAGRMNLPFASSSEVTVDFSESWLTAAEMGSYISIEYEANPMAADRHAYITVKSVDGNSETIKVTQGSSNVVLDVDVRRVTLEKAASSTAIPFTSSAPVSVRSGADWCTARTVDGFVEISAEENTTGKARTCFVAIYADTGSGKRSTSVVTVLQVASRLSLRVEVREASLKPEGNSVSLPYSASVPVKAVSGADWCKVDVTDNFIVISADAYTAHDPRICYVSVTTDTGAEYEMSRVIKVTQHNPELELSETDANFGFEGGTRMIRVNSTGNWKVDTSTLPSWMTVEPTRGDGDATVVLKATSNMFTSGRSAQILFLSEDESLSTILRISQDANSNGISSYLHLGKGYDMSGYYAEESCVKASVLDCELLEKAGHIYGLTQLNSTEEYISTGANLQEYQNRYTAKAGIEASYAGFSAAVNANFSEEAKCCSENQYATLRHMTKKSSLRLNDNLTAAQLSDCISENFASDVRTLDAAGIVSKYGTHVIVGFSLGGVLEYSMTADATEMESAIDWGVAVKAGYEVEGTGSVNASASYDQFNSLKTKANNFQSRLKCRGGQSQYASMGNTSTVGYSSETYSQWLGSLEDRNNIVLVDYEGTPIPIYEFITDLPKKAQVRTAVQNQLKGLPVNQTSNYKTFRVVFSAVETTLKDASDSDNEFAGKLTIDDEKSQRYTIAEYKNEDGHRLSHIPQNIKTEVTGKQSQEFKLAITKNHSFTIASTGFKELDLTGDDEFKNASLTLNYDYKNQVWTYLNSFNTITPITDGDDFIMIAYKEKERLVFYFTLYWK